MSEDTNMTEGIGYECVNCRALERELIGMRKEHDQTRKEGILEGLRLAREICIVLSGELRDDRKWHNVGCQSCAQAITKKMEELK